MEFTPAKSEAPPPSSPLWFTVPACVVIAAVAISMMFGGQDQSSVASNTSYDASKSGFRALYLILDELGYGIERSRRPAGGAVRWVLNPLKPKASDVESI